MPTGTRFCCWRYDVPRPAANPLGLIVRTSLASSQTFRKMKAPSIALGYVILYVPDVAASLRFYEEAFGLDRRFFHQEGPQAYGELETGSTRLAFASVELAASNFAGHEVIIASADRPPLGSEIAFVTDDVAALFGRAVQAGAVPLSEPSTKPWGQMVAYVRDNAGHLVELCSPMS